MIVWVAKTKIMKIKNTSLSPFGFGQVDGLCEAVSVGSWLWRQRWAEEEGLAALLQTSQSPTDSMGIDPGWELSLQSWTNRTHSYSLTKSKVYSCQAAEFKGLTLGPCPQLARSHLHRWELFTRFSLQAASETWPRAHLLPGAVLDLPHITLISPLPYRPPLWNQCTGQLKEVRILHRSGSQKTCFATLILNTSTAT